MNKDIILYIHNPLDEKLLDRCLQSLLVNQKEDCKWNTLYLYNAGTLIDNDTIIEKLQSIDTENFFCEDFSINTSPSVLNLPCGSKVDCIIPPSSSSWEGIDKRLNAG